MSTVRLYTPEVLAMATGLAGYPLDPELPLRAEARSPSCGSTIQLGLALNQSGTVERVGVRSQACAIGQASAAIFAAHATCRSAGELVEMAGHVAAWLKGEQDLPDWPQLALIAAARDYPARHGALLLPWKAVTTLLSTGAQAR